MLDESHNYKSQLLRQPRGRVALPTGLSKEHIQVERRMPAGTRDSIQFNRLIVINACVGPVALVWLPPTPPDSAMPMKRTKVSAS